MSCKLIGKPIETIEMSSAQTVAQSFTLSSTGRNKLLQAVTVGLCVENPTMTSLTFELWSDNAGAPGKMIAQSTNAKTRAMLLPTNNYGFGWFHFTFNKIPLRAGSTYWLVPRCTGYTYSANNHLAWKHAYPDPQYRTGLTLSAIRGAEHPLECSFIMADL